MLFQLVKQGNANGGALHCLVEVRGSQTYIIFILKFKIFFTYIVFQDKTSVIKFHLIFADVLK